MKRSFIPAFHIFAETYRSVGEYLYKAFSAAPDPDHFGWTE